MTGTVQFRIDGADVGAPVAPGEWPGRTAWRVSFGRFALTEQEGELTPKSTYRRKVVEERYKPLLDALYAER